MHSDMMSHVVPTLRWLPDPFLMHVGRLFFPLPDTPYVVKLHSFLKKLPPLIVRVFHSL